MREFYLNSRMDNLMKSDLLKPDSTKNNFMFQFMYRVVVLVLPLIVSPYLTRKLGGTALGVYTYTYSIAYYFVVFAMLGIEKHGQRIISQRREDIIELRKTFWSLYFVHFATSMFSVVAYAIYLLYFCRSDISIAFAQTIYVASAIFDLTWLFYGLEKFKTVTIRNAIIKLLNTACIFLFVKQPSDIVVYTLIMSISTMLGNLALFPQVLAAIPPIRFDWNCVKEHTKPLLTLFVAVVAATLYTVFDKTLLGIMATKEAVAYYEYSDKIINIPKTFITIISTVLFPKACQCASLKDFDGMHRNMEKSVTITGLIGFASCFGLLAIANQFALLYYGEEFAVCGEIISLMTPLILIIGIGETARSQYIYPLKMDMVMVKVLFFNAAVNLSISAALIPSMGIRGAVFGTITAETSGLIIELIIVRKYVSMKWLICENLPFAIIGLLMFLIVRAVSAFLGIGWISLILQILIGAVSYSIGIVVYLWFFKRCLLTRIVSDVKKKFKK